MHVRVKDEQIEQLHEIIKNLTIGQLLVRVKRGMKVYIVLNMAEERQRFSRSISCSSSSTTQSVTLKQESRKSWGTNTQSISIKIWGWESCQSPWCSRNGSEVTCRGGRGSLFCYYLLITQKCIWRMLILTIWLKYICVNISLLFS